MLHQEPSYPAYADIQYAEAFRFYHDRFAPLDRPIESGGDG
jgi:hypothetical protein